MVAPRKDEHREHGEHDEQIAMTAGGGTAALVSSPPPARIAVRGNISPAAMMAIVTRPRPPRIERRRVARSAYRTQAWLQPVDETGAIRPPLIHTRDLDPNGLGFIARQDVSAMGEAVLHLPAASGRSVRIPCRIRRSREIDIGWFEGVMEFVEQQPMFAVRRA
jgi:hypothetical protein